MTKTIITKPNNRPIWVAQEGTGGENCFNLIKKYEIKINQVSKMFSSNHRPQRN